MGSIRLWISDLDSYRSHRLVSSSRRVYIGDEIQTVDDLLLSKINNGDDVYEVTYKPPLAINDSVLGRLLQPATSSTNVGPLRSIVRWLVQAVVSEVQSEFLTNNDLDSLSKPMENRYMAVDQTSDRVRSQID